MNPKTRLAAILALGAILGLSAGCRKPASTGKTNEANTNDPKPNDPKPNDPKPSEKSKEGPLVGQDTSLRLNDIERVELRQGGSKAFDVSINRTFGFKSEVKFSLQLPPGVKGVTFTPADWQLNSNDSNQSVTARAAPDASVGTFTCNLVIRPRVGKQETRTLTVVVGPK